MIIFSHFLQKLGLWPAYMIDEFNPPVEISSPLVGWLIKFWNVECGTWNVERGMWNVRFFGRLAFGM